WVGPCLAAHHQGAGLGLLVTSYEFVAAPSKKGGQRPSLPGVLGIFGQGEQFWGMGSTLDSSWSVRLLSWPMGHPVGILALSTSQGHQCLRPGRSQGQPRSQGHSLWPSLVPPPRALAPLAEAARCARLATQEEVGWAGSQDCLPRAGLTLGGQRPASLSSLGAGSGYIPPKFPDQPTGGRNCHCPHFPDEDT
ncbi:hypothetical protein H1C71_018683, partial [Ictidomys tridecemlineatus]